MKTCACGRYIGERYSRCMSCVMRAKWQAGAYDSMVARSRDKCRPEPRLTAMRWWIERGASAYRAAGLVFLAGLGPSVEANRRLWGRREAREWA